MISTMFCTMFLALAMASEQVVMKPMGTLDRMLAGGASLPSPLAMLPGEPRMTLARIAQVDATSRWPGWLMYTHGEQELISKMPLVKHVPWDLHLSNALIDVLWDGGSFIDVGCNIGSISLPVAAAFGNVTASQQTKSSRNRAVYCIEAAPRNARLVWMSSVANGFADMSVINVALVGPTSTETTVCMGDPGDNPENMGGEEVHFDADAKACGSPVQATMLDKLARAAQSEDRFRNFRSAMALKMDCEGCEGNVVLGGEAFFAETPPCYLATELTPIRLDNFGTPMETVYKALRRHGYEPADVAPCLPAAVGMDEASACGGVVPHGDNIYCARCVGAEQIDRYFELAFATKDLGLPNGEVCSKRLHCTREHVDRCRRTCALNQQFNFWFVQKDLDQCKRRVLGADFS